MKNDVSSSKKVISACKSACSSTRAVDDQINYLESIMGVKFSLISKADAAEFLENNTYLSKLEAYAKNYPTYKNGEKSGKYCNLDFFHLKEMSVIDMHVRRILLRMCLDIEHYLKVSFIKDIFDDPNEDGYRIAQDFLQKNPRCMSEIEQKNKSPFCQYVMERRTADGGWAIWSLVEVMSFGWFIQLYRAYYERNRNKDSHYRECSVISHQLSTVKFLRNAAAHNNCIINDLNSGNNSSPSATVMTFLDGFTQKNGGVLTNGTINKKMKNKAIHDFVVSLYVFNSVVSSKDVKTTFMEDLASFFDLRMVRNAEYFTNNTLITSSYRFAKDVIDIFKTPGV